MLKKVRVLRRKGCPRRKLRRVIADSGYDSDPLRAIEEAGKPVDRAVSQKLQKEALLRWAQNATIQAMLDRGANECMARSGPRLLVRHEYQLSTCCVFFRIACFCITLR